MSERLFYGVTVFRSSAGGFTTAFIKLQIFCMFTSLYKIQNL